MNQKQNLPWLKHYQKKNLRLQQYLKKNFLKDQPKCNKVIPKNPGARACVNYYIVYSNLDHQSYNYLLTQRKWHTNEAAGGPAYGDNLQN
jgi:hypothetical protein